MSFIKDDARLRKREIEKEFKKENEVNIKKCTAAFQFSKILVVSKIRGKSNFTLSSTNF